MNGEIDVAREHQSIAHSKLAGIPAAYMSAYSLIQLTEIEMAAGDFATAAAYATEAMQVAREAQMPQALIGSTRLRTMCAIYQGDVERARELVSAIWPTVATTGQKLMMATYIDLFAWIAARTGDIERSLGLLGLSVQLRSTAQGLANSRVRSMLQVTHELRNRGCEVDWDNLVPLELTDVSPTLVSA